MSDETFTHTTTRTEGPDLDEMLSLMRALREREPAQLSPASARRLLAAVGAPPTGLVVGSIYMRTSGLDVCVYPGDVSALSPALLPLQGNLATLPAERFLFGDMSPLSHR